MNKWRSLAKNLTMITQLGLSFIMPLLLCVALCWYLCDRFSMGGWIYILGFFFGLGASFMTAYKFFVSVMADEKKQSGQKKKTVSFNKH